MSVNLLSNTEKLLQSISLHRMPPRRLGRLVAHEAMLLEIEGFPVPLFTPVRIAAADGRSVAGEIIGFRKDKSLAMPMCNDVPFAVGAPVVIDGNAGMIQCGPKLLGRTIDAMGKPLDGVPLPDLPDAWPLAGKGGNPLARGRVTRSFDCGVRSINALLSLGCSPSAPMAQI